MDSNWNGPNGQYCGNCFFWFYDSPQKLGECHRYPPKIFNLTPGQTSGIIYDTQVPETMEDNWCGEWKGRPIRASQ